MIFEELHYIIGRPGELITAAGNYITSAALSGIFMPCVCVMHCRRRFFFGKNDVPGFVMPCVCVMHCRRHFFFGKNDVPVSKLHYSNALPAELITGLYELHYKTGPSTESIM